MASLRCPSSPSSLQLRFGCRCRESSSIFLRVRFRSCSRRITLSLTARAADGRRGAGQSWNGSNGSSDAFSGWSDAGIGSEESKNKGSFGGMLGAGIAGILFAAGVTMAALSLTNKNVSGPKQQMEPLTAEQDVLISSDNVTEKDDGVRDQSGVDELQKESRMSENSLDSGAGMNKDLLPPRQINEDVNESRSDNMQDLGTTLMENSKLAGEDPDAFNRVSSQDDLKNAQDNSYAPVPPGFTKNTSELSAYAIDNSSVMSNLTDLESARPDALESVIRHDVNIDSTKTHDDLTSIDTDQTNQIIDNHDGILNQIIETPLHFPSDSEGQLSSQSLIPTDKAIESSDTVDPEFSYNDVLATSVSVSKDQDNEQKDQLQLPAEASSKYLLEHDNAHENVASGSISKLVSSFGEELMLRFDANSSPEGYKLNESDSSLAHSVSVSVSADPGKIESDIKYDNEIDRRVLLDSHLPKKSVFRSGLPAPSLVSAALQVSPPGKVLVPPVVDQVQGQAFAALQALKVIEVDVQPDDLCTRREYARWLVSASNVLSRNTASKVYPAMYIENVTELSFDDVTPIDPDFPYIQGLAEAGLISSKLSTSDLSGSADGLQNYDLFYPDSPLSRQDLVTWKMALERMEFPEVDRNYFYQHTGYIDTDKINPDAWPALVADMSSGEHGITALAFGYTRLFQPDKPVTKAQAAIALATGDAAEVVSEELARIEAESLAETAVNAHNALVAQVEKDLNASFEEELAKEREKITALEKLAEEARLELARLRTQREEEKNDLIAGRAAVESEMEVLSRLRHEVEEQLQSLMSDKLEISFEKEKINKFRKEAESENQVIVRLQYELEVERKALSMARSWAEEEAKRAREQAKALEEARERWERHGIKVVAEGDLQDDASIGTTWLAAGERVPLVDETIDRGENLVKKLKDMAAEMKLRSSAIIDKIIQKIVSLISTLKQKVSESSKHAADMRDALISKAKSSRDGFQEGVSRFGLFIGDRARRVVEDCKEGVEKFTQKFKA